jgi:hypothetical protein
MNALGQARTKMPGCFECCGSRSGFYYFIDPTDFIDKDDRSFLQRGAAYGTSYYSISNVQDWRKVNRRLAFLQRQGKSPAATPKKVKF